MNILMLHNAYQIRGGEDESFDSEVRMLRDAGHFVETIHVHNDRVAEIGKVQVALGSIWSRPSFELTERKLMGHRFDVLHVQNFFPLLSPSVYSAARKHGVPVVQTLRNYRLLCPSVLLFRDGGVCEDCLGKTFKYPAIMHRCYRGSLVGSMAVAAMTGLHQLRGTWRNDVDLYISLTDFARNKFLSEGFRPETITTKSNFVYPDPGFGSGDGDFILFVGRLTPEKGIATLLTAWERVKPNCALKIVGEGPLADEVAARAKALSNVEWLGPKPTREVHDLMGKAKALVFPSEWYETFGRVAIESFSKGTPVIASRIGAIAEIVADGKTGRLFASGDPQDLASKLAWIFEHPAELKTMRVAARLEYETKYTAEENCRQLIACYRLAERLHHARSPERELRDPLVSPSATNLSSTSPFVAAPRLNKRA
jgi:glycosyltransferase involved in cell wall biosynthesis